MKRKKWDKIKSYYNTFILISLYMNLFVSYLIAIQFIEDKFNHPLSEYLWFPLIYFISFFITEISSNRIDKNYTLIEVFI